MNRRLGLPHRHGNPSINPQENLVHENALVEAKRLLIVSSARRAMETLRSRQHRRQP
jgi:hypothetical protein